jgi:hypothetical protein
MLEGILAVHFPGFEQTEDDCQPLLRLYESLGLRAQLLTPIWRDLPRRRPRLTLDEVRGWFGLKFYARAMTDVVICHSSPGDTVLLSGHSLGAVIAGFSANIMDHMLWPPARDVRLAVYSYSAFPEGKIHTAYRHPGSDSRRMSGRQRRDIGQGKLLPELSPAMVFCGREERKYTQDMYVRLLRTWFQAEGFMVDSDHDVNSWPYLERIGIELPRLLKTRREWELPELPPDEVSSGWDPDTVLLDDEVRALFGPIMIS